MKLGLDRTNFAKDYLMRKGIFETKIYVSSKGQKDLIESNAIGEDRSKNKRTAVILN
jgi:outer membrane protein OmpA-like peptidoglycan-associated protein